MYCTVTEIEDGCFLVRFDASSILRVVYTVRRPSKIGAVAVAVAASTSPPAEGHIDCVC